MSQRQSSNRAPHTGQEKLVLGEESVTQPWLKVIDAGGKELFESGPSSVVGVYECGKRDLCARDLVLSFLHRHSLVEHSQDDRDSAMAAIEARLKYLQEAAHLLCFTAPTAAATFGLSRGKLLENQDLDLAAPPKEWDAFRREVCGACGNLMLPGRTCEVRNVSRPTKGVIGAKASKQTTRKEKDVVYTCMRCNRKTLQALPLRAAKHMRKSVPKLKTEKAAAAPSDSSHADKGKVLKSSNASSKQRAKARKGGLSAMLAQSKSQSSASKGLDLMDFMS